MSKRKQRLIKKKKTEEIDWINLINLLNLKPNHYPKTIQSQKFQTNRLLIEKKKQQTN